MSLSWFERAEVFVKLTRTRSLRTRSRSMSPSDPPCLTTVEPVRVSMHGQLAALLSSLDLGENEVNTA